MTTPRRVVQQDYTKIRYELPPSVFINHINNILPDFDYTSWRTSNEWKTFIAGYNSACDAMRDNATNMLNRGESPYRIFENR